MENMEIKGLSESLIRRYSDISAYKKGEKYLKKGNLLHIELHGHTISASVQGDNKTLFEPAVLFDKGGIVDTSCTCNCINWCEHIVTALLGVLRQPDLVIHRLDLKELLKKHGADTLKNMILKVAQNNSDMEQLFIKYLSETDLTNAGNNFNADILNSKYSESAVVDSEPFSKKVIYIIKKYEGRENIEDAVAELSELVDEALDFVAKGNGKNAVAVMESIINSYVQKWMELDGSLGDTSLFFEDLDMAFAKSILIDDLTKDENRKYIKKIEQWQQKLVSDGIEDVFVLSMASLVQGWDDPVLQLILNGERVSMSIWGKKIPEYAPLLTAIRLEILDIQKKYDEYLNLALHENCFLDYIMMLIKINRPKEALKTSLKMLTYNYQSLTIADELRKQGYLDEALEVAEYGLTLEGASLAKLALWLSERYEALGENQKALDALLISFKEEPSFNDFIRIRELADKEKWIDIRNNIIAELGKSTLSKSTLNISDIIDIFLHEGLINKAIKIVDKESEHYKELLKVLDAAIKEKPEWVIKSASARAEALLEQANAKHYAKAVSLLQRAQTAYNETKMGNLWNDYKTGLLKKHSKKAKLITLIEKLP